jgi:hypothetical protein
MVCSIRGLAVAVLLVLSTSAFAATLKDAGEARKLSDQVMAKVAAGDTEAALRLTKPYLIIPDSEFETMVGQMKLQAPVMAARFGSTIGAEFVRQDAIGDSLFRVTYIQKFEKHPMRWVFYFYKGKEGWVLNTFRTDDVIQQLFP